MTNKNQEPSGRERLVNAYNRMTQRVHSAIEETEDHLVPTLQRNIEKARERAIEVGELSREEAEKVGSYLQRDLDDAGHYLAKTGQEFGDWLRIDLEAIEDRMLELFASVADKTKLEWLELERDLREGPPYHTGEITSPGTLICDNCGTLEHFQATGHIPPCSHCQNTVFRRIPTDAEDKNSA